MNTRRAPGRPVLGASGTGGPGGRPGRRAEGPGTLPGGPETVLTMGRLTG